MRRMLLCAVLTLGACGGSDDPETATTEHVTTTTQQPVDCPGFRIGEIHDNPPECWLPMLEKVADDKGVELTDAADGQAKSLCRRIDAAGVEAGTLTALADWETGAAADPADDIPTFIPLAIAVYCPKHYEELQNSR